MKHYSTSALLPLVLLAGCAYNVQPPISPAINIYSSYEDKLPGRYIVVLDDSLRNLNREISPSSYICSAHRYPLELGGALSSSVKQTLDQSFEETMEQRTNPPLAAIQETGAAGVVLVRLDSLQPRVSCQSGFWTTSCTATTDISFGVNIRGKDGQQLFGTSVGSSRTAQGDAGGACGGGATLLAQSIGDATKDALERMAERISNSARLRQASAE